MPKLENIVKIVSAEEFETLALRVGNDVLTRFELVEAILNINSLMEGAEILVDPKHRRKKQ
tara:strand:+ start:332 stop:514 length:183 start_codon:yes stop_codon:yes gene_type:complete